MQKEAEDLKRASKGWVFLIVSVLGIILISNVYSSCERTRDIERATEQKVNLKSAFEKNPEGALADAKLSMKAKQYADAKSKAKAFIDAGVQNETLAKLYADASKAELVQTIKGTTDAAALAAIYSQLSALEPDNKDYKQNLAINQKKAAAILATALAKKQKYGDPPHQSYDGTYRIISSYLESVAKDPESVKVRTCSSVLFNAKAGWIVLCDWTAKNGFGGAARSANWFVIRHDQVLAMQDADAYRLK